MAMDFWRQQDIVSSDELDVPIVVIGAGGIGSPTVLALAKMGCTQLTVYDDDLVESHNIPNQLFLLDDIGRPKVEALAHLVQGFTGTSIRTVQERVAGQRLQGIVISGVDTMSSRHDIWQRSIKYKPQVRLYVDARMGAEVCRIYSINPVDPDDVRLYEETLYTDEEATEEPCTARSIIYNVFGIAALIGNQVKKHAKGEEMAKEIIFDLKTLLLLTGP
ncbi:MAG: ThiF family adenylyltransferase [Chloroflexi bacterium]|nr:ThiF family adenylyltransferase [Chloroflexota bacterium]